MPRRPPHPIAALRITPHLTAFALTGAVALAAAALATPMAQAQEEPPPALVVAAPVISGALADELTLVGTAQPLLDSLVASEIEGRVVARKVDNGAAVKKGQALVIIDSLRLTRELERASAELDEVKARLERARRQETRARELHDSDVLAATFLDEAFSERLALEGRQAQVEAGIASVRDDMARTTITAPFAGIVTEVHTEVGEWLPLGAPVVRLADFDTIEITLDMPERYYPHVAAGDAAPAVLDSLPEVKLDGKVFAVVPRAGSAARTFPVLVRAANPGHRVGAGMLAQVRLVLTRSSEALQVPKDAIVRQHDGDVVYVIEGGTARAVKVRTGRASGSNVEVAGDLSAGQRVVVRGNERLMPGQRVQIAGEGGTAGDGPVAGGGTP